MSDLISRQDAIKALQELDMLKESRWSALAEANPIQFVCRMCLETENVIEALPSAEPEQEEFEWCHDCKEYDQEKHCCHRWTKVIRKTVEEVKSQYALEYPKIIHCEDCKFYTPMNRALKTGICSLTMHHLGDDGFCSDAERRGE